jgi:DHA1 family multidrug resistance protein-like MFS transporter
MRLFRSSLYTTKLEWGPNSEASPTATVKSAQIALRPRIPVAVLAAALLFNLGQGILRPSLPLFLQQFFGANYRMVTLIPVMFGAGKWVASLPTGYLLDRLGRRRLMVVGLLVIAVSDIASILTPGYLAFLGVRGVAGMGWAMFGTVATTMMVDRSGAGDRGRAVSLLLMSETLGLLLGSVASGWLYQGVGAASPLLGEAACMIFAATVVKWRLPVSPDERAAPKTVARDWRTLREVIHTPGVLLMSITNAVLTAVQTGVLVFLLPLYLVEQGRLGPEVVGYLVGLGVLGRLVALWFAGKMSDRWGRMGALSFGLLLYGIVLRGLTLVTGPALLGIWSFMVGASAGFVAGLPTAITGDRVMPPLHGIAVGWLRTVTDTGMLVGPVVMGTLADSIHLTTPFLCSAVVVAVLGWQCRRQVSKTVSGASS